MTPDVEPVRGRPDRPEERWCPSCRMRYRIGQPAKRDFNYIDVGYGVVTLLLAAAREFDETAERIEPGACYTAVDFLDWLRPSLRRGVVSAIRSEAPVR